MNKFYNILLVTFLFTMNLLAQNADLTLTARDKSLSEQQRKDPTIFADPLLQTKQIGQLRMIPSSEIKSSFLSIGFECLDRYIFDPEKCYDKLGATGIKWARCQTGWNRCETVKGKYDFTWLDEVVDNLLQRGIQPWFNVGFGNKLYMPEAYGEAAVGWVPIYFGDEVLKAWGNYIKALSEHFKGRVTHYEIWNEPNIDNFWQPGKANAPDYYKLIAYTSDIIKKVDKNAKTGACVSGSISGFVVELAKLNVGEHIDFFGIHPYRVVPEKGYEQEIKALRLLFDSNNGKHVELWQGEVGFGSYFPPKHFLNTWVKGSETMQAKWLLRRYALDLSLGVKMSSFFQMVDMNNKEYETSQGTQDPCLHGILHGKTYEPKEAYYAVSYFTALFDSQTQAKDFYFGVSWNRRYPMDARVSRLQEVAVVTQSYERNGYPVYQYYLPEDVQMQFPGMTGIDIHTLADAPRQITKPILIDLLSGRVFAITDKSGNWQGNGVFRYLPLTDYPLVVTDLDAIKERISLF